MTLLPLPSEFPFIWGQFNLFFISVGKYEENFLFFFISVPAKHDDHDHDVADEPQDEDPEVGHKEQEDHARGHDQRLLDLVTADQQETRMVNVITTPRNYA